MIQEQGEEPVDWVRTRGTGKEDPRQGLGDGPLPARRDTWA